MDVFRYWIGASPQVPTEQVEDLNKLHEAFWTLDKHASVEQYGVVGGMILLKVETEKELTLDFEMPPTVIAFERRRH